MRKLLPLVALLAPGTFLPAAELLPPERPVHEVIDHYIEARLSQGGVAAEEQASDAELVRRTTLDLVGRIPTVHEVRPYLDSKDPAKRNVLVDRLLESRSFVEHQADQFDWLLMDGSGKSVRDYLVRSFASNRPWDAMFRDMLLGDDSDDQQQGAIEFVRSRLKDLDKLANQTSAVFFGVNVSCAKCHDHPEVRQWTQAHFYGMKSFFSRTFDNGGFVAEREYGVVKYKTTSGTERQAALMYLTGSTLEEPASKEPSGEEKKKEKQLLDELKKKKQAPPKPKFSRREQLVEVALQENQYFARSIVNRLWRRFFGYGMVMPVDQMHPENPPSHPELLEWLARDLIAHQYDLRRLIRGMVLSRTYARSSRWQSGSPPSPSLFAVARVRPLTPQQYAASLRLASTSPDHFAAAMKPEDLEKRIEAVQIASRSMAGMFQQPGEDFQVSVSEALLLSNGERIQRELLRDSGDSLLGKMKQIQSPREALQTAVWTVLSRPADDEELAALLNYVQDRDDHRDQAYRQVVWALLTSSESRFNY